mgnify:CR=1 FL=1
MDAAERNVVNPCDGLLLTFLDQRLLVVQLHFEDCTAFHFYTTGTKRPSKNWSEG